MKSETQTVPAAAHGDPADIFFSAARDGVLMIQRCERCATAQFALPGLSAAVALCRTCAAPHRPWVRAAGSGNVVSYTILPARRRPDGETPPPRVAGIVELDEGPWIQAGLDVAPDRIAVGHRVGVRFADGVEPDRPVPVFTAV